MIFAMLQQWLKRRRQTRQRWQADARVLVEQDEVGAYYEAQRRAARARTLDQAGEFLHWAKVAAEVARISPHAEMDLATAQAIVDSETRHGTDIRD